jgi:glycerol-3-phosphate dehydrogenase (NAD+)
MLLPGCKNKHIAPVLRDIIQTEYFRVVVVDDVDTVEVCGALKVKLKRN